RAEPVFIQIETKTGPLGNREHALAYNRFRTLRHFFLVTSESAQSVLHFEEVLRRGAQMHGRIESDQRTRPAVHAHRRACQSSVVGDLAASCDSTGVRDIRMNHSQHLVVEVWPETFDQLDL